MEAGTIIASNYRVMQRLGAGGMGTVYLAENVTLAQKVVVKVLRGGLEGAGHEEAQMLASLGHPNVVTVFAHDPALDCIVMEHLDGASLDSLVDKGLDHVNAIRIALAIADALAAVHRRGLVHRDIKPENVMLALHAGGGRVVDWLKLIDFGLALKQGKTPPILLGTPEFCGPEQFFAQEAAHPGNDVYALGVTLFLMITGTFPFLVPQEELPAHHLNAKVPSVIERLQSQGAKLDARTQALFEDLDELIHSMMSKLAKDRPAAQDVARRLTKLESNFAEAGTYVGSGASMMSLPRVPEKREKRASTGMLKKLETRATGGELAKVPSSTGSHAATNPDLDTVERKGPVPVASPPSPRVSKKHERTAKIVRAPAPVVEQPSPSETIDEDGPVELPRSSGTPRWAIPVLGVIIIGLIIAVLSVEPNKPTTVERPTVDVETSDDAGEDAIDTAPSLDAGTPTVVAPPDLPPERPVVVDAGAARLPKVEDPVDAGAHSTKPVAVVKPPATPKACVFNKDATRAEYNRLVKLNPKLEEFEDELFNALKASDCRRAEAVLRKMKAQRK